MRIDASAHLESYVFTSPFSLRGEQRVRGGHPWIIAATWAGSRRCRRHRHAVKTGRGRVVGQASHSDHSQIALPHADARRRTGRRFAADAANQDGQRSRFASRSPSTSPRIAWFTAKRTCCRRSSSIVTATTSSCRRCRRGVDRQLPLIVRVLRERLQPGHPGARSDPLRAKRSDGLPQEITVLDGDGADLDACTNLALN